MNWSTVLGSFIVSAPLSVAITVAMMRWAVPREVKRLRQEADLWHGRCLYLQRVVNALASGKKDEARRLLMETKDEEMMRALGRSV